MIYANLGSSVPLACRFKPCHFRPIDFGEKKYGFSRRYQWARARKSHLQTVAFSLLKHSKEELIISVSFPDVKGALTPTVRTALVHAIGAFRIAKITSFTHKTFSIIVDAALDICLPTLFHRTPKSQVYFSWQFSKFLFSKNVKCPKNAYANLRVKESSAWVILPQSPLLSPPALHPLFLFFTSQTFEEDKYSFHFVASLKCKTGEFISFSVLFSWNPFNPPMQPLGKVFLCFGMRIRCIIALSMVKWWRSFRLLSCCSDKT